MTLLEVIVSFVFAAGVIAASLVASSLSVARTGVATLEFEAALKAEALLSEVSSRQPIVAGQWDGEEQNGVRWQLEVSPENPDETNSRAFWINSDVMIARAGLSVRRRLSTLKLQN